MSTATKQRAKTAEQAWKQARTIIEIDEARRSGLRSARLVDPS